MACNGCTKKFGLFLKENGCPSCKYSFCSKCLKFRIKLNGKNRDVCLRCSEFSKLNTNPNVTKNVTEKNSSILDATSAETVQLPEVIQPVSSSTSQQVADDDLIRERLAALKDPPAEEGTTSSSPTTNPESSLTDIEKRLAALKGVEYKDYSEANKKFLLQKDNRTQEEQIRDLMKQFAEEQEIHETVSEYRLAAVDDIEKRLAALKGEPGDKPKKPNGFPSDDEEETEEEAARKLAARFLEEAAIDAQNPAKEDGEDEDVLNNLDIPKPLDPAEIEEELPWCTICNEDAVVRCLSCDGDLFCRGCFRECHEDDEDYRAHKTKPYKGKPVPGEG